MTSLVSNDAGGHPDVLAAQIIVNAISMKVPVTMLLTGSRDEDAVWRTLMKMLSDGDKKSAACALSRLPLLMHAFGQGWDRSVNAQLVYAPGLSPRDMRRLGTQTRAPILVIGTEFDGKSVERSTDVIRVGEDALVVDSEGFEVPVVYDPSGPIYRPA